MISEFIKHVESYVGTRYMHQARLPGVGLDCAGVVVCAAREIGIDVQDISGYSRTPSGMRLTSALAAHCDVATYTGVDDLQKGDILAFIWDLEPQHIGVYVGDGYIVHAHAMARRTVKHRLDAEWHSRIALVFRIKGVTHE